MDHTHMEAGRLLISPPDFQMSGNPTKHLEKRRFPYPAPCHVALSPICLSLSLVFYWPTYQCLSLHWAHLSLLFAIKSNPTFTSLSRNFFPHYSLITPPSSYVFLVILRNFYLNFFNITKIKYNFLKMKIFNYYKIIFILKKLTKWLLAWSIWRHHQIWLPLVLERLNCFYFKNLFIYKIVHPNYTTHPWALSCETKPGEA